ncbi:hypothetical protein HDA40_000420 [Hamadaea flava]|uniref:Uncharacterized protein n=1 Tax=Hamadaea flava TaxID=1742688 RepID=A0ABV8LZ85_9ACTN|nr:hypothetical protein [Hamadaea flava]MCP2321913.1 hypothetical protein [Hamadaea flava]
MTGSALLRPLLFVAVVLMGVLLHPAGAHADDRAKLTDAEARARLKAAGITWWSSSDCTNRLRADCTSFDQIRRTTIAGVVTLRKSSTCPIMVTGGTETGHGAGTYTHWNGWKVDIALNDCVNKYVRSWFHDVGTISGWGHQYRAPSGNLYTNEGNHWDILYYTCGGCDPEPVPPRPAVAPDRSAAG